MRPHLSGFFWGDCSLSNTLFRYDAGTPEPMDQTADGPAVHGPAHGASYGTGDRQQLEADASSE